MPENVHYENRALADLFGLDPTIAPLSLPIEAYLACSSARQTPISEDDPRQHRNRSAAARDLPGHEHGRELHLLHWFRSCFSKPGRRHRTLCRNCRADEPSDLATTILALAITELGRLA